MLAVPSSCDGLDIRFLSQLYFRGFMCRWLAHYFQYTSAPSFVDVSLRELHPFAALVTVALYSAARTRNSSEVVMPNSLFACAIDLCR
jgi:hypothetical protein